MLIADGEGVWSALDGKRLSRLDGVAAGYAEFRYAHRDADGAGEFGGDIVVALGGGVIEIFDSEGDAGRVDDALGGAFSDEPLSAGNAFERQADADGGVGAVASGIGDGGWDRRSRSFPFRPRGNNQ